MKKQKKTIKRRITKEQALKVYNNPKTKILFELYFPIFEDYWRECEKLNSMTEEEYQEKIRMGQKKVKQIEKILNNP